jgi:hypothetical protein
MTFGKAFRTTAERAGFGALIGFPIVLIIFTAAWGLLIGRYFMAWAAVVLAVLAMLTLAAWDYQHRINRRERGDRPPRSNPLGSLMPGA